MRIGQNAVGAANVIEDHFWFLFQQRSSRVFFVLDELRQHFVEPLYDVRLGFAQGHLV